MTNNKQKYLINSIKLPDTQVEVSHQILLTYISQKRPFSIVKIEGEEKDRAIKWAKQQRDCFNAKKWAADPLCLMRHFEYFSLNNIRQRLSNVFCNLSKQVKPKTSSSKKNYQEY
jgi:hypothetical protein